jgi:SAM-dependent methyltransferase
MNVLICSLTHDGRIDYRMAERLYNTATKNPAVKPGIIINRSSALVNNMNKLWCTALNFRKQSPTLKWFAMLHSDIVPDKFWLDTLMAEAELHQADMISAISPHKDASGVVSTAIEAPSSGRYPYMRLTLNQCLHAAFPETFDTAAAFTALTETLPENMRVPELKNFESEANLLINTGCMIIRVDKPWAEELYFYNRDEIFINPQGQYQDLFMPEDWNFSRMVSQVGRVMATRKVKLLHIGDHPYDNCTPRGNDIDEYVKPVTIWSLDDARRLHLHSPTLAEWLISYLPNFLPVYDFGCGKGEYVAALEKVGFTAFGFEGTPGIESIAASKKVYGGVDITDPAMDLPKYHASVISLEVMEHILPEQEEQALKNITSRVHERGKLVVSWAVPGQQGHGHNNCRPASYVVPRIEAFGFKLNEILTASARKAGGTDLSYFNETIYVFNRV